MKRTLRYSSWSLKSKIVIPIVLLSIVVGAGTYVYLTDSYIKLIEEDLLNQARSIVYSAEGSRAFAVKQLDFSTFRSLDSTEQISREQILNSLPIISAIETARASAEESGFRFRVPKMNPRNPDNAPEAWEAEILSMLQTRDTLQEYWREDHDAQALYYFRPIRLTEDCMPCHGDPKRSEEYWGRSDGKDITGTRMEGWETGEVHGAYEVIIPLQNTYNKAEEKSFEVLLLALGIVAVLILCGFLLAHSLSRRVADINTAAERLAQGDYSARADAGSSDEIGHLALSFNTMTESIAHRNSATQVFIDTMRNVIAETELESALEHVIAGAKTITGAKYGAIAVFRDDGSIEHFVHDGIPEDVVARIGRKPEGKGLLGHLQASKEVLRLANMQQHTASSGFPAGHPPMKSLLGVPILHEGKTMANIYLSEKTDGRPFSVEDEDAIKTLANFVPITLSHKRALADMVQDLLSSTGAIIGESDLERSLKHTVQCAKQITGAKYGAITVFDENEELQHFVHDGIETNVLRNIGRMPSGKGLLGHLQQHKQVLRLGNMQEHPASVGFPKGHPPMKSLLGVPILHEGRAIANLYLSEKQNGKPFSKEDEEAIKALAQFVPITLQQKKITADLIHQAAGIRAVSARLVDATTKIRSVTEQIAAQAEQQSSQGDDVSAAVEEMIQTIAENANNTTQTASVASQSGTVARDSGDVVNKTVNKIQLIADIVQQSAKAINSLDASAGKINEITAVINDIAEQTNLLALNAAIEAARAGDQGRGFAVVADEVRKLAERTSKATKEIETMIREVQNETKSVVGAVEQGNREAAEGLNLADQTGKALREILSVSGNVENLVNQIASASEEQAATSQHIAQSINQMSNVSREAVQSIHRIVQELEGLGDLASDLERLLNTQQGRQLTGNSGNGADKNRTALSKVRPDR